MDKDKGADTTFRYQSGCDYCLSKSSRRSQDSDVLF